MAILLILSLLNHALFSSSFKIPSRVYNTLQNNNNNNIISQLSIKMCPSGSNIIGSELKTPDTIFQMMNHVAKAIYNAKSDNISTMLVDIPLPVTGGTEWDDWPGGIKQKYSTLYPMLIETMKTLQFRQTEISKREYLGMAVVRITYAYVCMCLLYVEASI